MGGLVDWNDREINLASRYARESGGRYQDRLPAARARLNADGVNWSNLQVRQATTRWNEAGRQGAWERYALPYPAFYGTDAERAAAREAWDAAVAAGHNPGLLGGAPAREREAQGALLGPRPGLLSPVRSVFDRLRDAVAGGAAAPADANGLVTRGAGLEEGAPAGTPFAINPAGAPAGTPFAINPAGAPAGTPMGRLAAPDTDDNDAGIPFATLTPYLASPVQAGVKDIAKAARAAGLMGFAPDTEDSSMVALPNQQYIDPATFGNMRDPIVTGILANLALQRQAEREAGHSCDPTVSGIDKRRPFQTDEFGANATAIAAGGDIVALTLAAVSLGDGKVFDCEDDAARYDKTMFQAVRVRCVLDVEEDATAAGQLDMADTIARAKEAILNAYTLELLPTTNSSDKYMAPTRLACLQDWTPVGRIYWHDKAHGVVKLASTSLSVTAQQILSRIASTSSIKIYLDFMGHKPLSHQIPMIKRALSGVAEG